eukprot:407144_1
MSSFFRNIPLFGLVSIYLIASVITSECVKITLGYINRPYFIRYISSSMAIILFIFPLYGKMEHKWKAKKVHSSSIDLSHSHDQKQGIIEGSQRQFILYTLIGAIP